MKRLLLVTMAFLPFLLAAQSRGDAAQSLKILKTSQTITNPVGWFYDAQTKNWCGWYGALSGIYKSNHKTPKQPSVTQMANSYYFGNIVSMQMKESIIDTTTCYLLYIESWNFYYDYPAISVDRHNFKSTYVFVFSKQSYDMLWALNTGITMIPIARTGQFGVHASPEYGFVEKTTEKTMLTYLNDISILKEPRIKTSSSYWYVKKEDDETIRFLYPGKATTDIRLGGVERDFNGHYFEVSTATFNKLKIE